MVSTFTPNIQIEEPARGDDVGTWDTPVNANMSLIDLVAGGTASISVSAGSVVLSAAQFQCKQLSLSSTLAASITLTFPTSFKKSYEIQNAATGTSAFTITCQTTAAGGQVICVPPGETADIFNDGSNLKYKNLGRVGEYWDYAGSSVPAWVSGCTVPPYLNCDGSTFNSSVYPALAVILGSSVLPDSRGRTRAILNQGTGRMTSGNGGVDGNTLKAAGGNDAQTLTAAQIPTITVAGLVTVNPPGGSGNFFPYVSGTNWGGPLTAAGGGAFQAPVCNAAVNNGNAMQGNNTMTSNNTAGGSHTIMQPTYVGGLTLIRAG